MFSHIVSARYKRCKLFLLFMLSVSSIVVTYFILLSYSNSNISNKYIVTIYLSTLLAILVLFIQLSMKVYQLIIGVYNLQRFQS